MEKFLRWRNGPEFERLYMVGVGLKGIDGLIELLTGLTLLFVPGLTHSVLQAMIGEAHEHTGALYRYIAENIAHVDGDLAKGGTTFLILFLVSHGIIKIVLVYCLIRELTWAYPYALGTLALFLIYQIYACFNTPGIAVTFFAVLDAIIIWLVWGEWQKLKNKKTVE